MIYLTILFICLFILSATVVFYFLLSFHAKINTYTPPKNDNPILHPISIIICARNEAQNLINHLPHFLNQDYPSFEIIVVNDRSFDETESILKSFQKNYPNLKTVQIVERDHSRYGKKFAVTMGIKAAKYEHLLFTDADCYPNSKNWIQLMQRNFSEEKQIIIGISPYIENDNSILNKWIQYESFQTAVNYISFAIKKIPYMGVGRNMAYTKTLFFKGKGFASHLHILSGDDDLFINQHANKMNTAIAIDSDSLTFSIPQSTFNTYWNQKLRHLRAGKMYKFEHKKLLSLQIISHLMLNITTFYLLISQNMLIIVTLILCIKLITEICIYRKLLNLMQYRKSSYWFVLFNFFYSFFILSLSISGQFKRNTKWK